MASLDQEVGQQGVMSNREGHTVSDWLVSVVLSPGLLVSREKGLMYMVTGSGFGIPSLLFELLQLFNQDNQT